MTLPPDPSISWDGINWKGYGRPYCKLTLRINPDSHTWKEALIHEWHAETAEYILRTDGISQDLLAKLAAIRDNTR